VAKEVARADETMEEVDAVTEDYVPLANMASRIYFALDSLPTIHFLYQFSLQQFMHILFAVIQKSERLNGIPKTNHEARRLCLTEELFDKIYDFGARGLLGDHQPLFAMRLAQIRKHDDEKFERLFAHLMRSSSILEPKLYPQLLAGKLSKSQCATIEELEHVHEFQGLVASMQDEEARWLTFMEHPTAETVTPEPWLQNDPDLSPDLNQLMKAIVVRILRPDRLIFAARLLIGMVLGDAAVNQSQLDLDATVETGTTARSPLLLVSAPGYDASVMVD